MATPPPSPTPKSLSATELKRLHRGWRRDSDLHVELILDGVQNPFNIGALFRSAAAYTVKKITLVGHSPSPDDPKVAKTALGCQRLVPWERADSGVDAVAAAASRGLKTVAIELTHHAEPLFHLDAGPSVALILGHEDRGVHPATMQAADVVAFLPQLGKVGSLNVAQAGTVAMYELARQRWSRSPR